MVQQGEAFAKAAKAVDTWMQKNAPAERAMLIAEDAPTVKRDLKTLHAIFQSKDIDIRLLSTKPFR